MPVRGGATISPRWPLPIGRQQVHHPHPERLGAGLRAGSGRAGRWPSGRRSRAGRGTARACGPRSRSARPAGGLSPLGRTLDPAGQADPLAELELGQQGGPDVDVVRAPPCNSARGPGGSRTPWGASPGHRNGCVRPCSWQSLGGKWGGNRFNGGRCRAIPARRKSWAIDRVEIQRGRRNLSDRRSSPMFRPSVGRREDLLRRNPGEVMAG